MSERYALRTTMVLGLLVALAPSIAAGQSRTAERFSLSGAIEQGGLVYGRAGTVVGVSLDNRALRLTGDGRFIFGIGRDEKGPLILKLRYPDGRIEERRLAVAKRTWRIQRLTGLPRAMVTPPKRLMARLTREYNLVRAAREADSPGTYWDERLDWPVQGRVSSVFGSQRFYNGTPRAFHTGVDVAKPRGAPVRAPAGGVVTVAHEGMYFAGKIVMIDHGFGLTSSLLHMSKILVKVGDKVRKGQTVGLIGATGRVTGPNVHWSLSWFQTRIDPMRVVGPMPRPRRASKRRSSKRR